MGSKKVLVTGGAGFIGSHLCGHLLQKGDQVICLDNFVTGSRRNLLSIRDHPHFTFVPHDVIDPMHLVVDEIYNLACPASPVHYQYDPVKTAKTSVLGAINVLELARETGARVLQASTSEVYGDPLVHPQAEEYWGNVNPIGIRSCYDEGKRCAETLFADYHRQYGVEIKIVRIFNTYGPHMHPADGRVVSNFIVQALKDEDLTIYGDGQQTRSFCYVDDLVDGLIKMMASEPAISGPINLGNTNELTIMELAQKIIKMTHSSSRLVFKELPGDDPHRRRPELERARTQLDWLAVTEMESGLKQTIDFFQKIIKKKSCRYKVRTKVMGNYRFN